MDWAHWMCLAGGVSQDAVEASRVGWDRISGGHLNICRVDVMFPFGCWISYRIADDERPGGSLRTFRAGSGSGSGPLGMNIQINSKITYVECTLGTEY